MPVVEDPLNRETIEAITQLIVVRLERGPVIHFGDRTCGVEHATSGFDMSTGV